MGSRVILCTAVWREVIRDGEEAAVVEEISNERRFDQLGCVGEYFEDRVIKWEMQDMMVARDMSVWGRMFSRISGTVENL